MMKAGLKAVVVAAVDQEEISIGVRSECAAAAPASRSRRSRSAVSAGAARSKLFIIRR